MSLGHEEDGNMKMGRGQGCWEPLGHASGSHVEKGRQDTAGYWSLHVAALGGFMFLISVRLLLLLHPNSRGVEILHILLIQAASSRFSRHPPRGKGETKS